jgi:polyhydroxyalkanoate synthesis regulator phasin
MAEIIKKKDLTKLEENLARMIAKGFDENTKQHQEMMDILNRHAAMLIDHTEMLIDHTERLKRIETKLEGIVYRKEFDELKSRVERLEKILAIKKEKT